MRRLILLFTVLCLSLVAVSVAPQPARADSLTQQETTYVVQTGDTLFRIGLRFGISTAVLASFNGIANPNLIYVGQTLRIPGAGSTPPTPIVLTPLPTGNPPPATVQPPGGSIYVVQPGDTLSRIAARFGTTVAAVVQANGIVNPNLIYVGQRLNISGGGSVPVPTPAPGTTPLPPAPPPSGGNFQLGGQIQDLNSGTQGAMRIAKMTWVKRQARVGDDAAGLINQAHGAGFKILLSVVGDKNAVLSAGYSDSFASYVRGAAQSGADAIEVWNEMNLDREWPRGSISGANYVPLLAKAYAAIKAVNPNTIVVSGAPAPTGAEGAYPGQVVNDDRYYAQMAAAGAGRYADCIGVHYNEGIVAPTQTSGDPRDNYPTRYFRSMLNRALASFPGKQACYTEIGYLTPEGYGALPANFGWASRTTVSQQAAWIAQAAQIAESDARVRLFMVFNLDFTSYTSDDPQAGYALIRPGGGCPGCTTLGSLP